MRQAQKKFCLARIVLLKLVACLSAYMRFQDFLTSCIITCPSFVCVCVVVACVFLTREKITESVFFISLSVYYTEREGLKNYKQAICCPKPLLLNFSRDDDAQTQRDILW